MSDELDDERVPLSAKLHLIKAVIEKLHELTMRDINEDISKSDILPTWEGMVTLGKWNKTVDFLFEIDKVFRRRYSGQRGEMRLVEDVFGDQLGLPDATMPEDVGQRLEWYRQRVAKEYEKTFRQAINDYSITSPVEQIFLLEWNFLGMNGRLGASLHPQHEITMDGQTYKADFVVLRKDHDLRLVVEIDGHDFHEKTRSQVAKDKARERAIVRAGYTVLRFTGSEVVRNPRKCVEEVASVAVRE